MTDTLTPPVFLETNPAALVDGCIAAFEASTGRTLYPAQIERLLVDLITYRESLVRQGIQQAAEQNLVDFATGGRLESLGRLLGVSDRLAAAPATCIWRLTLPAVLAEDKTFPLGWTAMAPDGSPWETTAEVTIPAGSTTITVSANATNPGAAGNGIVSGSTFNPLENVAAVVSTTDSTGGVDQETDEQLRARVLLAPFGFSVAGSAGAYRFHAMSASAAIIDVAVKNIAPGEVGVYPLTATGLPDSGLLSLVTAALDPGTVRPLCDAVTVAAPTEVPYVLEANLTFYNTADVTKTLAAATDSGNAYNADRKAGLGRDLVGSQAIKALSIPGVYKVELLGWTDHVLAEDEWAHGTLILHNVGSVNG